MPITISSSRRAAMRARKSLAVFGGGQPNKRLPKPDVAAPLSPQADDVPVRTLTTKRREAKKRELADQAAAIAAATTLSQAGHVVLLEPTGRATRRVKQMYMLDGADESDGDIDDNEHDDGGRGSRDQRSPSPSGSNVSLNDFLRGGVELPSTSSHRQAPHSEARIAADHCQAPTLVPPRPWYDGADDALLRLNERLRSAANPDRLRSASDVRALRVDVGRMAYSCRARKRDGTPAIVRKKPPRCPEAEAEAAAAAPTPAVQIRVEHVDAHRCDPTAIHAEPNLGGNVVIATDRVAAMTFDVATLASRLAAPPSPDVDADCRPDGSVSDLHASKRRERAIRRRSADGAGTRSPLEESPPCPPSGQEAHTATPTAAADERPRTPSSIPPSPVRPARDPRRRAIFFGVASPDAEEKMATAVAPSTRAAAAAAAAAAATSTPVSLKMLTSPSQAAWLRSPVDEGEDRFGVADDGLADVPTTSPPPRPASRRSSRHSALSLALGLHLAARTSRVDVPEEVDEETPTAYAFTSPRASVLAAGADSPDSTTAEVGCPSRAARGAAASTDAAAGDLEPAPAPPSRPASAASCSHSAASTFDSALSGHGFADDGSATEAGSDAYSTPATSEGVASPDWSVCRKSLDGQRAADGDEKDGDAVRPGRNDDGDDHDHDHDDIEVGAKAFGAKPFGAESDHTTPTAASRWTIFTSNPAKPIDGHRTDGVAWSALRLTLGDDDCDNYDDGGDEDDDSNDHEDGDVGNGGDRRRDARIRASLSSLCSSTSSASSLALAPASSRGRARKRNSVRLLRRRRALRELVKSHAAELRLADEDVPRAGSAQTCGTGA